MSLCLLNCIFDGTVSETKIEMHPRILLRRENVPRGPDVVSRWVKADWTDFKVAFHSKKFEFKVCIIVH